MAVVRDLQERTMTTLQDLYGLKGKVALVTGASSGLGIEFAKGMAIAGADVALVARRKERLETLAAELRGLGVRCAPVQADVGDDAQIERAVAEVEQALGPVDILVNNAGIADYGRAEKLSLEKWDEVVAVNLTGLFRLTQRVAARMIERGKGGRVINLSSVVGKEANAIFPTVAYAATKHGVEGMTKQMAIEWAKHGITVNAIAPGWFPTEMNIDPRVGDIGPKHKERMIERTPMGRLGQPGELMGVLIFLASPAASYVTGVTVPVDGGWLVW
jgi:gluconate 5-dehydrogenase